MAPVVVAKLPTASADVREQYVQRLIEISNYSRENEPSVSKYAVFVPRDEADANTAWVIEEYKDQASFDAHMAHPLVQDMIKWMGSGNILKGTPTIHMLDYVNDLSFSKPQVVKAQDPFVVFATIEWHPGKRDQSIPYWTNVLEESRTESGTFVYGVLTDSDKTEVSHTLEAYESKDYLWDVHVKQNAAVHETVKDTKQWRISLEHNFLKMVGGFISR